MSKPTIDLTTGVRDTAVYLPAISSFYSAYVAKQRLEEFVPKDRIPKGFDRGIEGMNFLNPEQGYFYYKYALYSAGHAQLDLTKAISQDSMIHGRDKNKTMILGDSGGYQIGKGVIQFDWKNFDGPAANKIRDDILAWLEFTADWSMMLDVPTWACLPENRERTGLTSLADCLNKTRFNNEYWLSRRLGHTKFLNVLQGSDWDTAEEWYQGVKEFSDPAVWGDRAAEGWAFGGVNMCKMDFTLKRLISLREDGLLKGKNWIHFLGTAQLDWACYLTSIQRQLRKHINEEVTISFDCASPFVATAHGLCYTDAVHTPKKWSTVMDKAPDSKLLAKSEIPFPFESEIGKRLNMGDICWYAPGDLNKIGKEGKTSWDSFAYALLMGHNVYQHIAAVQKANNLADIEHTKFKKTWRQWEKLNSKDSSKDEPSPFVPRNILYFDAFVKELFETKTKDEAFNLIDNAKVFLQSLDGSRLQGGPARNTFHTHFEVVDASNPNDIDTENPDDEKLAKLENDILGK